MARWVGLLLVVIAAGCAAASVRPPADEEGLPLLAPPPKPPPPPPPASPPLGPAPPLSPADCSALSLVLPGTHSVVLTHEAYVRAFDAAVPALREAVCACPPRTREAWIMVRTTPDHGDLSARSRTPDEPIDACLADHLRDVALPRWHLGGDCIGCGPKRYGVFRGSPPVDSVPEDGTATLTFLVGVAR